MMSLRRALLLGCSVPHVPRTAFARTRGGCSASLRPVEPRGRPVPQQPLDDIRLVAEDRSSRQAAEAGLRRAPVRLRRHRRPQHARRLQHAAADLDPVHRPDRSGERRQLERVPDPACPTSGHRDQPDHLGSSRPTRCTSSPTSSSASTRPTSSSSRPTSGTQPESGSSRRSSARTCTAPCPTSSRGLPGKLRSPTSPSRPSSRPRARRRCSRRCAARSRHPPRRPRTSCSAPAASGRCSRPRT